VAASWIVVSSPRRLTANKKGDGHLFYHHLFPSGTKKGTGTFFITTFFLPEK
jgi:hypothetical protein